MTPKKAQVEVTFNWVYILVAGAVILLFFIGLVAKQKAASEEKLSLEVVRVMESLFVGAGAAEKTKNVIDVSGLADYTLYFRCEGGVGEFGLKGPAVSVQNAIDPLFAPAELKTSRLTLWSLPYKLPFKVIDFLFITSDNTKYFLLGEGPIIDEFLKETESGEGSRFVINREKVRDFAGVEPGKNFQVRLVDFKGGAVREGQPVPGKLQRMDDNKVTAITFTTANQVDYYQKEGGVWKKLNQLPVRIISLSGGKDAARYAAIFAADDRAYQCNMEKAFRRLRLLMEVYGGKGIQWGEAGGKLKEMIDYYAGHTELLLDRPNCFGYVGVGERAYPSNNLLYFLTSHQNHVQACLARPESCPDLIDSAQELRRINQNLAGDCLALY